MRIVSRMIRVLDGASKIGTLAGSFLCFVMMTVITIDVVVRTMFNISIVGAIEMAVFALVLMAFFAQAGAYTDGRHITVDFFLQKVSSRTSNTLEFITLTISLTIMVLMSIAVIVGGIEMLDDGETSYVLQLPIGVFKAAAGGGLLLLCLSMLRRWITLIVGFYQWNRKSQQ